MKVSWSPEEDLELRRIYSLRGKHRVSAGLDRLTARYGMRKEDAIGRAAKLGIRYVTRNRRPWTATEDQRLREGAGRDSIEFLSRMLGRSYYGVLARLKFLNLSGQATHSYSLRGLSERLGSDPRTIKRILTSYPMECNSQGRFTESDVQIWFWEVAIEKELIDLRACDQQWLKRILKEVAA